VSMTREHLSFHFSGARSFRLQNRKREWLQIVWIEFQTVRDSSCHEIQSMDQSGVSVRRATVADALSVESLASLLATTFSIDPDAFTVIFERVINDEDTRILASVDERGAINGYLLGFIHDAFFANGPVGWIEEMYVADFSRHGGVGFALERDFEAWARSRGAKLIALATRRAASFYLAIGFEESAVYLRKIL